jgi:hypothetical protein
VATRENDSVEASPSRAPSGAPSILRGRNNGRRGMLPRIRCFPRRSHLQQVRCPTAAIKMVRLIWILTAT